MNSPGGHVLGARLRTSQPRVAKIERAASDVSLDQLVRAFVAAGGQIAVRVTSPKSRQGKTALPRSERLTLVAGLSK